MKLPLRYGLPLLALLLLGLAVTEGAERFALLLAAMGVALWSAFSLPHPGPRQAPPALDLEPGPADDAEPGAGEGSAPARGRPPGPNGERP
jgi:hypothetical protein